METLITAQHIDAAARKLCKVTPEQSAVMSGTEASILIGYAEQIATALNEILTEA